MWSARASAGSSYGPGLFPEIENGNAGEEYCDANERIRRISNDGVDHDERADSAEERGRPRMAGHEVVRFAHITPAKDEDAAGGDAEENEIHADNVIEYLLK